MDLSKVFSTEGKLKIPDAPLMFFLDLTQKCNLQCWFCYNDTNQRRFHARYEDLMRILSIMHDAGCNEVTYLGGEPTIHPQFFDILHYADALGMQQGVVSNGQLIDDAFAAKLKEYPDLEVGLSIHSFQNDIQNKITGSDQSFARLIRAVQSLENNGVAWYSQTSLIKENYLHLQKLSEFLQFYGHPKRMDLSRMVEGNIESNQFLTENDYIDVFTQIDRIDTNKIPVRIEAFPRCWIKRIANEKKLDYDKIRKAIRPCYAWVGQISIDIFGNVRLCPTGGKIAGNILESGLETIWKASYAIQDFQAFKWQKEECLACDDFAFCVGACKMTCKSESPTPDCLILKGGLNNACNNE